ncbi:MAG: heme-binding protein [Candidatus Pelagadaptatus aseana]|uniref:SOUL family heme-binding protein n=1 Tax=Candidatus Pelagadaptatus aseana TaxID=3120508 RepID=UPI0039B32A5A
MAKYTIEHAPFTLLESEDNFELRHYPELLLVSAPMNSQDKNSETPFRMLFAYITGNNSDQLDIPMTAPVFMDPARSEKMSFVLPADFTLATTPQPTNPDVTVERIENYHAAVIRFNGRLQPDNIATHMDQLTQWINDRNYQPAGNPIIAGYDPPSSLPALRRNEVLIPVAKPQ